MRYPDKTFWISREEGLFPQTYLAVKALDPFQDMPRHPSLYHTHRYHSRFSGIVKPIAAGRTSLVARSPLRCYSTTERTDLMNYLTSIDAFITDLVERSGAAFRRKTGVSYPHMMAVATAALPFLLALSVFLGRGDILYFKIPLLVLYAGLAFFIRKTIDIYIRQGSHWDIEAENWATSRALANRSRLFAFRSLFGIVVLIQGLITLFIAVGGLRSGAISAIQTALDVFVFAIGMPTVLVFIHLLCARPLTDPSRLTHQTEP